MDELEKWLIKNDIPEEIRDFILQQDFPFGKKVGTVHFDTPKTIIESNEFDLWPNLPKNKLLTVGSATNGDLWAINFRQNPINVVVLPLDNMPQTQNGESVIPDSIIVKVADSPDEFMKLAREDKLPLDYYEAREQNEKV
jgi:hypothetical protein